MFNVPDDWGNYYSNCSRCNSRVHASEGGCQCWEEYPHDCYRCEEWIREGDEKLVPRSSGEGELVFCTDCAESHCEAEESDDCSATEIEWDQEAELWSCGACRKLWAEQDESLPVEPSSLAG